MNRKFQIVIWGATGFTGRLVTEYIHINYGKNLQWAIAGRDYEKLKSIKRQFQLNPEVECLVGDSFDEQSLKNITSKTKVVISTVGPYMIYGKKILESCVSTETDYCDLTGEIPFVKESIDSFHKKAKDRHVKIVHSCGYDAIPSDLGCWLLEEKAIEIFNEPIQNVKLFVLATKGKFSGGTIASMVNLVKNSNNEFLRRLQSNPYVLCKHITDDMPRQKIQNFTWYDPRVDSFTAPFLMATFNTRVVFRTNDLSHYRIWKTFYVR